MSELDNELNAMKSRCENYSRTVPHHADGLAEDSKRLQSLVSELRLEIEEADKIGYQMGRKGHEELVALRAALSKSESNTAEAVSQAERDGWAMAANKVEEICDEFGEDPKACLGILGEWFSSGHDALSKHNAEVVRPWREWAERVFHGQKHFDYCPGELPPPNVDCLDDRCKELRALLSSDPSEGK